MKRIEDRPERRSTSIKKKNVLLQLEKTLGVVAPALRKLGIPRSTYSRWLEDDPDFREKVAEMEDLVLDFAESSLHKQIKDGIPGSTIFFLKTKGKHRGYVERQEIVNTLTNRFEDMSDAELIEMLEKTDGRNKNNKKLTKGDSRQTDSDTTLAIEE